VIGISSVSVEFSASGCDTESGHSEVTPPRTPTEKMMFVGAKALAALDPARKEVDL